jgi:hypothetical protein
VCVGAAVDLFSNFCATLDDADVIEALFFVLNTTPDKPWSVRYLEYGCGYALDSLKSMNQDLTPTARRELVHRLFGGAEGLFARRDRVALKMLTTKVAELLLRRLGADGKRRSLIESACRELFVEAKFPSYLQCEILATLFEFYQELDGGAPERDAELLGARMIKRVAGVLPAGVRLIQSLLKQPGLFTRTMQQELSTVQDRAGEGAPLLPFHCAKAEGMPDILLGEARGQGSMAEVHDLPRIGDRVLGTS